MLPCKNVQFLSLVKVNSENSALKGQSSFDSPRYDCVLFMSLIKLNGKCFAAKNVQFLSLVNVNTDNLALKYYSSSNSPRYDCVLFMSLIKVNSECFAEKNVQSLTFVKVNSNHHCKQQTLCCENWQVMFYPPLRGGLPDSWRTFFVTHQGKQRTLCC